MNFSEMFLSHILYVWFATHQGIMAYMLQNMNVLWKDKKLNRYDMHIICWEVSYEVLDYKSKHSQIRTFSFSHLLWMAWFQFSKKTYLIKQHYWYLMFFIKFNYFIWTNILQIVFYFITYSIATFVLSKKPLTCPN